MAIVGRLGAPTACRCSATSFATARHPPLLGLFSMTASRQFSGVPYLSQKDRNGSVADHPPRRPHVGSRVPDAARSRRRRRRLRVHPRLRRTIRLGAQRPRSRRRTTRGRRRDRRPRRAQDPRPRRGGRAPPFGHAQPAKVPPHRRVPPPADRAERARLSVATLPEVPRRAAQSAA